MLMFVITSYTDSGCFACSICVFMCVDAGVLMQQASVLHVVTSDNLQDTATSWVAD